MGECHGMQYIVCNYSHYVVSRLVHSVHTVIQPQPLGGEGNMLLEGGGVSPLSQPLYETLITETIQKHHAQNFCMGKLEI